MASWIGWVATAVFAASYACRRPATLRRVQAGAAVLWVVYGVLIQAAPVVVANLVVAGAALFSSFRKADSRVAPVPCAPAPPCGSPPILARRGATSCTNPKSAG